VELSHGKEKGKEKREERAMACWAENKRGKRERFSIL